MSKAVLEAEAEAVDAFLLDDKRLDGIPNWHPSPRPGELSATWNIQDSLGIVRAALRFRCPRAARGSPSISLVFREDLIWRIDLVPQHVWKPNPPSAVYLGLPPEVYGSHSHRWYDNRAYVLSHGFGSLPYRRPLPVAIRRLPQALASLAAEINLSLEHEQRRFDVPPPTDLFESW